MEDLLNLININKQGKYIGDVYTVDLTNYDEFSKIYNKLESSNDIVKNSNESYFNIDESHVVYNKDNYEINLNGDLDSDVYQLTIEEKDND